MRCFFHLVSYHDAILDETGIEVTDLAAAEAEAMKAIKELREEEGEIGEEWQDWHLRVTDRSGEGARAEFAYDSEANHSIAHTAG